MHISQFAQEMFSVNFKRENYRSLKSCLVFEHRGLCLYVRVIPLKLEMQFKSNCFKSCRDLVDDVEVVSYLALLDDHLPRRRRAREHHLGDFSDSGKDDFLLL